MTVAEVARRLKLYRSNISAMDAGRRSVSLKALARVGKLLDCSPADLIEITWVRERPLYRSRAVNLWVKQRDLETSDGSEKEWVHKATLAWQRHYRSIKR